MIPELLLYMMRLPGRCHLDFQKLIVLLDWQGRTTTFTVKASMLEFSSVPIYRDGTDAVYIDSYLRAWYYYKP